MTQQLEVGRTYRNREGDKVKIASRRYHSAFPFKGEDACHYAGNGSFDVGDSHPFDLVEECEAGEAVAVTQKPQSLCEAILAEIEQGCFADAATQGGVGHTLGMREAERIIRKRFAALTVEEVAKEMLRDELARIAPRRDFSEVWEQEKDVWLANAQAVMNLLRK